VGVKTAGLRWQTATTATQQLAVLTLTGERPPEEQQHRLRHRQHRGWRGPVAAQLGDGVQRQLRHRRLGRRRRRADLMMSAAAQARSEGGARIAGAAAVQKRDGGSVGRLLPCGASRQQVPLPRLGGRLPSSHTHARSPRPPCLPPQPLVSSSSGGTGVEAEGEPNGCLNDAPCSPCTRHGASIRQPFGAGLLTFQVAGASAAFMSRRCSAAEGSRRAGGADEALARPRPCMRRPPRCGGTVATRASRAPAAAAAAAGRGLWPRPRGGGELRRPWLFG
jgi:hypothetical protein